MWSDVIKFVNLDGNYPTKEEETMQDRQYLERQLTELKLREDRYIKQKDIFMAEHNIYIEEIRRQIDSIQDHFEKCLQQD